MLTNIRTVRIEWGDCDPMGIVYFPRYLAFFDDCTAYLFERALGLTKFDMLKTYRFAGFPMVDVRAKFLIPSKFGDDVSIETTVSEFRRSSFDIRHRLMKGTELAVEGFETRVWVGRPPDSPDRIKSQPIPREVIERFNV
ncbi:MAG TPA: thioesterase family protein [Xanthobacteraceae bacterium]|nr:thioesterase family protein [Xanthobacteraceae bacterium]